MGIPDSRTWSSVQVPSDNEPMDKQEPVEAPNGTAGTAGAPINLDDEMDVDSETDLDAEMAKDI